ncbi:Na+/melibiose symporter [Sporobacter termitidis DSM 10068]|uniref:Na+/melibiose symporter n=1 Tax=Sporobacter termitidis DSM 10068 TaxID=1123282 RepID=A0A1M5ZCC1_9FIRM|nr:SLC45 family MFS transporter [Sporobacter termitidis]SHI21593.1 Na+/melibiose symporter [Sporobacter termitidis DSM 10068]
MKLNYKKTFILGFGFFAISLCAALYDSYVPIFLNKFIDKVWLIGFLMTLDNYIGLFLQPAIGALSDRTNTKFGKRMPFILICMPLAAVFVSLIPNHRDLISLIVIIVLYNLIMASFRSPTIALMPDITPEPLRSKANGVINLMGGVGSVIAFLVGSKLYGANPAYPYYMAGLLLLISLVVLFFNIREKRDSLTVAARENAPEKISLRQIFSDKKSLTNVLMLLLAIFFWFVAFNSVSTFFTLYGKEYLHVGEAAAASKLTYFSLSMVVFAIPAGIIGTWIGKKKTIVIGISIIVAVFAAVFFTNSIDTIGYLFIVGGAGWALININSYPFVVSMARPESIGTYTGLYYLFSSLAAIASPPLAGLLIDRLGYGVLFKYSVTGFILALVCILFVKAPAASRVEAAAESQS